MQTKLLLSRAALALALLAPQTLALAAETHRFTPKVGYPTFAKRPPVLRIKPGDTVETSTLWGEWYERAGGAWPGVCVETAVSRLGRRRTMRTTSVSPGAAPSTWKGPTSPGHAPPARSYVSPLSVFVTTLSPGVIRRTGARVAKVG